MYEELKEWKELLDEGAITQEEFERKKYEILGMESPEEKARREKEEQILAEKQQREKEEAEQRSREAAEAKAKKKAERKEALRANKKRIIIAAALSVVAIVLAIAAYNVAVPKTAFAVFSSDDNSLTFYRARNTPESGDDYKGKECTAVYLGIEDTSYAMNLDNSEERLMPEWVSDGNCERVEAVIFRDPIKPISCSGWFAFMEDCERIDLAKLDSSEATDFSYMFLNCESLSSLDVSGLRTDKATSFQRMFMNCGAAKLNVSNFNTSNVQSFMWMFENCSNLTELDVRNYDFSSAESLARMFYGCSSLTTLKGAESWDVSHCRSFPAMFSGCASLTLDCSSWVPAYGYVYVSSFNEGAYGVTPPNWDYLVETGRCEYVVR